MKEIKGMLKILSKKAPAPIGPYSQAIFVGNTLYASGQIPLDAVSNKIVGEDITAQTKKVCQNIFEILKASGITFENVCKTTCFLANMDDFADFNKEYEKFFVSKPARSCVAVKTLPKNVLVEIEVIAVKQ